MLEFYLSVFCFCYDEFDDGLLKSIFEVTFRLLKTKIWNTKFWSFVLNFIFYIKQCLNVFFRRLKVPTSTRSVPSAVTFPFVAASSQVLFAKWRCSAPLSSDVTTCITSTNTTDLKRDIATWAFTLAHASGNTNNKQNSFISF